MKSSLQVFFMVLAFVSVAYGLAHLYVWWRLVRPLQLRGWRLQTLRVVVLVLLFLFPAIHFALHSHDGLWLTALHFVSAVWVGMMIYFVLVTAAYDLLQWLTGGWLRAGRSKTTIVTAIVLLITVYGLIEARCIGVTRLTVALPNLPQRLEGMRLVQISDVHMGRIMRGGWLDRIVTLVNGLQPDLILITGDLVDAEALHMEDMVRPLQRLQSRYGVYAVTGNHEYFAGVNAAVAFMKQAGAIVLRNRWVAVADGGVQLVGRDDRIGMRISGHREPSWEEILWGINPSKPTILLEHTPGNTLEELAARGIHLQLSGHTHQGQLWPGRFIVRRFFDTPYGLFTNDHATIYVSRGAGTWGPPMRVLAKPEITLITLIRKQ